MANQLKRILIAAAFSGIVAGLFLTFAQQLELVPLILAAEEYEPESNHKEWHPTEGLERTLFTAAANIVTALGFSLLLGAAMSTRPDSPTWHSGLLWGIAGYLTFFVAPSLGLPPELPGSMAAELGSRQLWWLATVFCTGTGLALLSFSSIPLLKIIGVIFLVSPHIITTPLPDVHSVSLPSGMADTFVWASALVNGAMWILIGSIYGLMYGLIYSRLTDLPHRSE